MGISSADFDFVRQVVLTNSGIVLESGKEYLVEARLAPLVRKAAQPSLEALIAGLRRGADPSLRRQVIEAMTTNETTFFRDVQPFEALRKHILPELIAARRSSRELSVWCAASSTGQEPYSLAMLLLENFPELAGWNWRIIASDLSLDVLERAREGRYNQIEINRGLPAAYLVKYFEKNGVEWQLKADVRRRVDYRQVNLVQTWPTLPMFDIVMIRNVMIYFDVDTKKSILDRIKRHLRPDGYLFLGAAETTMSLDDSFDRVQLDRAGCYRLGAGRTTATKGVA